MGHLLSVVFPQETDATLLDKLWRLILFQNHRSKILTVNTAQYHWSILCS